MKRWRGWDTFPEWFRDLVCRVFGHSKKRERKLRADLCARCRVVLEQR